MIIYINSVVVSCLTLTLAYQLHRFKFSDGLDHCLTLHSCLCRYIIVAVPTIMYFCAVCFADEKIYHYLSRNETAKYTSFYEKEAVICWQLLYCIYVCTFVAVTLCVALYWLYKPFFCQGCNYSQSEPPLYRSSELSLTALL